MGHRALPTEEQIAAEAHHSQSEFVLRLRVGLIISDADFGKIVCLLFFGEQMMVRHALIALALLFGAMGAAHAQEEEYEAGRQAYQHYESAPDTTEGFSGYLAAKTEDEYHKKFLEDAMHPPVVAKPIYGNQTPTSPHYQNDANISGSGSSATTNSVPPADAGAGPTGSGNPRPPIIQAPKPKVVAKKPYYRKCPEWGCGPNVPAVIGAVVVGTFFDLMYRRHRHPW